MLVFVLFGYVLSVLLLLFDDFSSIWILYLDRWIVGSLDRLSAVDDVLINAWFVFV